MEKFKQELLKDLEDDDDQDFLFKSVAEKARTKKDDKGEVTNEESFDSLWKGKLGPLLSGKNSTRRELQPQVALFYGQQPMQCHYGTTTYWETKTNAYWIKICVNSNGVITQFLNNYYLDYFHRGIWVYIQRVNLYFTFIQAYKMKTRLYCLIHRVASAEFHIWYR